MKDRTPWLDALKQHLESTTTEAHNSATPVSAKPVNESSESLAQHTDKTDRSLLSHNEPPAREALLRLFAKDREWQNFFRSCCEMSTYRLIAQAWQLRDELKDRGHPYSPEVVEDALLDLARELLPESAAAQWNAEWAHKLCKDALARLAEHYAGLSAEEKDALDLSGHDICDERMRAAGLENDPAAFQTALEEWEKAGLEAMKRVGARERSTTSLDPVGW
jgi:hypothetical protein